MNRVTITIKADLRGKEHIEDENTTKVGGINRPCDEATRETHAVLVAHLAVTIRIEQERE